MISALILEPASDWTRQSNEERLILCAETLFLHNLINARALARISDDVRGSAATWRERRTRRPRAA